MRELSFLSVFLSFLDSKIQTHQQCKHVIFTFGKYLAVVFFGGGADASKSYAVVLTVFFIGKKAVPELFGRLCYGILYGNQQKITFLPYF